MTALFVVGLVLIVGWIRLFYTSLIVSDYRKSYWLGIATLAAIPLFALGIALIASTVLR